MEWYIIVIMSAIFMTLVELARKKFLTKVHAHVFATSRLTMMAFIGIILLAFSGLKLSFEQIFITYLISIVLVFPILFINKATKHLEISVVAPMSNVQPAFILLFAFLFLKETPTAFQIVGIALLVVGAYLLELRTDKHSVFDPIKELLKSEHIQFLMYALILFSLVNVFEKYFVAFVDPVNYQFVLWIFLGLNFSIIHWYRYGHKEIRTHLFKNIKEYIILSIISVGAALTYMLAIAIAPITLVMPLRKLSTLFTTIIGGRIFKERNSHLKIIACIIMLLGAYLIIAL